MARNPFGSGILSLRALSSADARTDRRESVITSRCLLESPHLCTILFGSEKNRTNITDKGILLLKTSASHSREQLLLTFELVRLRVNIEHDMFQRILNKLIEITFRAREGLRCFAKVSTL